jgi:CelD/BcsL family acetyltransferase involved in cellulose biosynthesis
MTCPPLDKCRAWNGPIGENCETTLLAAMQFLRNAKRDWDLLELRSTDPATGEHCRALHSMQAVGLSLSEPQMEEMSVIDFDGTWERFIAAKPKKVRREMRRVFEDENAIYIRHRPAPAYQGDGDPRWDLFEMCEQVALASWQAQSNKRKILTTARARGLLRDTHAEAARLGMVDMNLLLVDGQPVAFSYNYHVDGRVTGLRLGYDTSASPTGFGRALVLRSLEDSFERGDKSYHLGANDSRFKSEVQTRTVISRKLTHARPSSWRAAVLRLVTWLSECRPMQKAAFRMAAAH